MKQRITKKEKQQEFIFKEKSSYVVDLFLKKKIRIVAMLIEKGYINLIHSGR